MSINCMRSPIDGSCARVMSDLDWEVHVRSGRESQEAEIKAKVLTDEDCIFVDSRM